MSTVEDKVRSSVDALIAAWKNEKNRADTQSALNDGLRQQLTDQGKERAKLERDVRELQAKVRELEEQIGQSEKEKTDAGVIPAAEIEEVVIGRLSEDDATPVEPAGDDEATAEEERSEEPASILTLAINERRRWKLKVVSLMRYTFRGYFGLSFSNRWGHFLDWQMSKTIHSYGDWAAYPKGNHSFGGGSFGRCAAAISTDGYFLFCAGQSRHLVKYDLVTEMEVREWEVPTSVASLAVHRSGILVSGDWENLVCVWDAHTCELKRKLEGHKRPVVSLDISEDGSKLISGSQDNRLRLWCLKTGVCLKSFLLTEDKNRGVCFIGGLILAGPDDRSLRVFDTESGRATMKIRRGMGIALTDICVNRDRSMVACMLDHECNIFEWPSMEMIQGIRKRASCGDFHPLNPDIIAFGHQDKEQGVRVYNAREGRELRHWTGSWIEDICFTPDGRRLVSIGKNTQVWDTSDLC